MRRARLPMAYTKGFSAHPKIAFGSGLPVGYGSEVELLDLELDEDVDPAAVRARLEDSLPSGLHALDVQRLGTKGKSLGELIVAADYEVECAAPWLDAAIAGFLALPTYEFARPYKGSMRIDDLRAGVVSMTPRTGGFSLRVVIKPRATRPGDVMKALAQIGDALDPLPAMSVQRTDLLTDGPEGPSSLLEGFDLVGAVT
ncbi:MAG: hypothetical protein QOH26_1984 [Actinomycetota bacterium]|nr:hypothetical protein [Actinomycetota bacterium]